MFYSIRHDGPNYQIRSLGLNYDNKKKDKGLVNNFILKLKKNCKIIMAPLLKMLHVLISENIYIFEEKSKG